MHSTPSPLDLQQGCYIGQETIAKVHNKNAVKQELWGLELSASCAVGDEVFDAEGAKLGAVTSIATKLGGQMFGLAYLRWEDGDDCALLARHACRVDMGISCQGS